jgi:hypothetical protein
MELSFSYTYRDYTEGSAAVRKPIRRPGQRSWEPILVGTATFVAMIVLMVVFAMNNQELPTGELETSYLGRVAISMFAWTLILGLIWGFFITRMDPAVRGMVRWVLFLVAVSFIAQSAVQAAFTPAIEVEQPGAADRPAYVALLPWVILFCGLFCAILLLIKVLNKTMWAGQQHLHPPHTIRFSEESVENETPTYRSVYRWEAFILYRESANLFILQIGRLAFVMIPKRACRDGQQVEDLRGLLERKVVSAQPRQTGFAVVVPTAAETPR